MITRTVPNSNPNQLESEIRSALSRVSPLYAAVYTLENGDSSVQIQNDLTSDQIVALDSAISNHSPRYPFDPTRAITEFYTTLSDQMFNNNVDFGKIGFMVQWENFQGLKLYAQGLLANGFITQDVYDRYKQIFLNQQINLEDY